MAQPLPVSRCNNGKSIQKRKTLKIKCKDPSHVQLLFDTLPEPPPIRPTGGNCIRMKHITTVCISILACVAFSQATDTSLTFVGESPAASQDETTDVWKICVSPAKEAARTLEPSADRGKLLSEIAVHSDMGYSCLERPSTNPSNNRSKRYIIFAQIRSIRSTSATTGTGARERIPHNCIP